MKWQKRNGQWFHHGLPCRPMTPDYEEIIEAQTATINALSVERDNWAERYRSLEAQFEPIDMPSQLDPARRAYLNGSERDDLDEFAERLPA